MPLNARITDHRKRSFCSVATLKSHGMDPWVFAPLRVATPKDNERDRSTENSAVDLLVDLVEHFRTVGAQIGEIAARQVLDFGDEAVVVAALGNAGAGAADKIVEYHDEVPFMPHWRGWVVPPSSIASMT